MQLFCDGMLFLKFQINLMQIRPSAIVAFPLVPKTGERQRNATFAKWLKLLYKLSFVIYSILRQIY